MKSEGTSQLAEEQQVKSEGTSQLAEEQQVYSEGTSQLAEEQQVRTIKQVNQWRSRKDQLV